MNVAMYCYEIYALIQIALIDIYLSFLAGIQ